MTLTSMNDLRGCNIGATDGELGKVVDTYFDDERWTVRYLVADVGGWLRHRKVLISPHAVTRVDAIDDTIVTELTRAQVEKSPPIDTEKPISRLMEEEYNRYYGYPAYWAGGYTSGLWGYAALPLAAMEPVLRNERLRRETDTAAPPNAAATEDVHLRSGREVTGYHVRATDGDIGHIEDILFEQGSWTIRYLVIDTRDWWPGRHVLVAPEHVREVSWPQRSVIVDLARAEVERSPPFDPRNPPRSTVAVRS